MKDYKLVCLILLAFGFNTMKSQNINYKTLLGIEHSNLVGDSLQLEKNTFIAFLLVFPILKGEKCSFKINFDFD